MRILNLTQHVASPEQLAAGVVEPADKKAVQTALTFSEPPSGIEINRRAVALTYLAQGETHVMIGGAGYLMGPLEDILRSRGITPLHSFTKRVVKEIVAADGTIKKESVFVHEAFVQNE